jgi:hypothetical protein
LVAAGLKKSMNDRLNRAPVLAGSVFRGRSIAPGQYLQRRAGIHTGRKIYLRFRGGSQGGPVGIPLE